MNWRDGFIAVDWGTTNRRAYAIDASGALVDTIEDDRGILSVPTGGFDALVAELRARFDGRPLLLAGMVGSNRGWHEVPYVAAPAALSDLRDGLWRSDDGGCVIVPGVSYTAPGTGDVMRGEEVQLIGAAKAGLIPDAGLVCHPGTHAKWASMRDGAIIGFRTIMTGELFNLLRKHSILADLMKGEAGTGPAFDAGVDHALGDDDLTAELFSTRAQTLLGLVPRDDRASYISGLLIGQDVKVGLRLAPDTGAIVVLGKPELTQLYAAALTRAGRTSAQAEGEDAFIAGAKFLAEML